MYEIFEQLCQKHNLTSYKVSKMANVTQTALSNWKNGKSEPSAKTLQKLADFFNVSVDYLLTGEEPNKETSTLTRRDTKEITEMLNNMEDLLKQDGLMFDGDPATPEAIDSILSAMKIGMEMAKQKNKEKYTPKKYKKDWLYGY